MHPTTNLGYLIQKRFSFLIQTLHMYYLIPLCYLEYSPKAEAGHHNQQIY